MPLDATGALFWNPASITDLKSSELDINGDLALVDSELSSSLAPNAFANLSAMCPRPPSPTTPTF